MSSFSFTASNDSGIVVTGDGSSIIMQIIDVAGPPGPSGPPGPTGVAGNPYVILDYIPPVNGLQTITLPFIPVNVFVYLDGIFQGKTGNYSWVNDILTFSADFNILTTDSVLIVFN